MGAVAAWGDPPPSWPWPTTTLPSTPTCNFCGTWHDSSCPRIKKIEYFENGRIKRVELFPSLAPPSQDQQIPLWTPEGEA